MNIRNRYLISLSFIICHLSFSAAQTVSSVVKAVNGQPVGGAIVTIVGEKTSVVTDDNGAFTLETADQDAVVTIKADGFYERALPLRLLKKKNGSDAFQVTLTPQQEALYDGKAETAYGTLSRDERPVTVSGVQTKDFSQKLSIGAALRDQAVGLQVVEKSGRPGEGTYMNIRGIHSFVADNAPLIVINGVP